MTSSWILGGLLVFVSAVASGFLVWLISRPARSRDEAMLSAAKAELAQASERYSKLRDGFIAAEQRAERAGLLESQNSSLQRTIIGLESEKARMEERLKSVEQFTNSQLDAFKALADQTKVDFKAIASEVVQGNSKAFLDNASLTLNPFSETFARYENLLQKMEAERQRAFGGINTELANVKNQLEFNQSITNRLVNALRSAPKTRGRWGEQTLQRVMELAQMVQHCDFDLEKSYKKLEENLRPDAVLHLAGDRHIIVDAKAPISAFLDAVESETEDQREAHLVRHAGQLRERMQSLASKAYWEKLDGTPDCVVMFVPGDNFFSAAVERDRALFDDAIARRVLIATPTTFIALAKAIGYGWRQQQLAESALHIAELGKELYYRLSIMGGHVAGMGAGLKRSVEEYNRFVGSLETSVMSQARRFQDLGVERTKAIGTVEPLETEVREVRAGRDLIIEPDVDLVGGSSKP